MHLFEQKYSKNSTIGKYYFNLKQLFSILIYLDFFFYSCYGKAAFSELLLQS